MNAAARGIADQRPAHPWRLIAQMQVADAAADLRVVVRGAAVEANVIHPGADLEAFAPAPGIAEVVQQRPLRRTVAPPYAA